MMTSANSGVGGVGGGGGGGVVSGAPVSPGESLSDRLSVRSDTPIKPDPEGARLPLEQEGANGTGGGGAGGGGDDGNDSDTNDGMMEGGGGVGGVGEGGNNPDNLENNNLTGVKTTGDRSENNNLTGVMEGDGGGGDGRSESVLNLPFIHSFICCSVFVHSFIPLFIFLFIY